MMLRPFENRDIELIVPQPSQRLDAEGRARIVGESVPRGPCWTCAARDGRILAIGGFVMIHPGWATAWTILAADIGAAMVGLTRAVAGVVEAFAAELNERAWPGRIDMHVDPTELASARWAMMLGFGLEAMLARALPDGRAMGVWVYEGNDHG